MDKKNVAYNICNVMQLIATVFFFILVVIAFKSSTEATLGTLIGIVIIQILIETGCLVLETIKIAIGGVSIIDVIQIFIFVIAIAILCWVLWQYMDSITTALDLYEQVLGLKEIVQKVIIWNILFVQKENYFFPSKEGSFFIFFAEKNNIFYK